MATFSIGEVAKTGFRIIREHPKAILAWSLAYFVIVLLPQIGGLMLLWPDLMRATEEASRTAGPGGPSQAEIEAALGMQGTLVLLQIVQFLTTILWALLFYGAVFRAVLEPENSRRWYMRFGAQEFWLGAVSAITSVMFMIAALAIIVPLAVLIGAFASTNGDAATPIGWIAVGSALLFGVLLGWVGIRLSLAYPMSFAERKFRLFESWAMTRGQAWRIFLTYLAAVGWALLVLLAFFVVLCVLMLIGGLVLAVFSGLGVSLPTSAQATLPTIWVAVIALAVMLGGALVAVQTTIAYTLTAAPSAAIYKRLREPPAPAQAA